jgi:hypothetical protein
MSQRLNSRVMRSAVMRARWKLQHTGSKDGGWFILNRDGNPKWKSRVSSGEN